MRQAVVLFAALGAALDALEHSVDDAEGVWVLALHVLLDQHDGALDPVSSLASRRELHSHLGGAPKISTTAAAMANRRAVKLMTGLAFL